MSTNLGHSKCNLWRTGADFTEGGYYIFSIKGGLGGSGKIWLVDNDRGGGGIKNMIDNAFPAGIDGKLQ